MYYSLEYTRSMISATSYTMLIVMMTIFFIDYHTNKKATLNTSIMFLFNEQLAIRHYTTTIQHNIL